MADATTEAPKTAAKPSEPEIPTPEAGPALDAANATYPPTTGNWSDPPELAKGESEAEGSHAAPLEEEVAKEREKIVKEGKERRAKAYAENDKKAEARAKHDEKVAKAAKA
jgi:hypothetical protein